MFAGHRLARTVAQLPLRRIPAPATRIALPQLSRQRASFTTSAIRMSSDASHSHLRAADLFSMNDLTAVVTGGGTGIGLMITLALVENGAKVFITGRRAEALQEVVKRYSGDGQKRGQIVAVQGDVTDKQSLQNIVGEVSKQASGGINILVNNAGVAGEGSREGYEKADFSDPESLSKQMLASEFGEWETILKTNVAAAYFCAASFLPLLGKGKTLTKGYSPQIINVTSISGVMKTASGGQYAYAASKAATFQMTKVLATELMNTGIRCNQIAPGIFPSEMTAGSSDEGNKSSLEGTGKGKGNPAGRPGDEKDMAGAILYLASRAGVFVNGQAIVPDGGATIKGHASL